MVSDLAEAFLKTMPLVATLRWGTGSVAPDVALLADSFPALLGSAATGSADRCDGTWLWAIGRAMAAEAEPWAGRPEPSGGGDPRRRPPLLSRSAHGSSAIP
jgi:hypothetical protein